MATSGTKTLSKGKFKRKNATSKKGSKSKRKQKLNNTADQYILKQMQLEENTTPNKTKGNERFIHISRGGGGEIELHKHSSALYKTIGTRMSLNNHVRNKSIHFGRMSSQAEKKKSFLTKSSLIPIHHGKPLSSPKAYMRPSASQIRACSGENNGGNKPQSIAH